MLVEPLGLFDEEFLDAEEIPVLADRLQKVVEEFIKFFPQVVSNEDDMISESDLVFPETGADLLIKQRLSLLNICQRCLDFLFQ